MQIFTNTNWQQFATENLIKLCVFLFFDSVNISIMDTFWL